MLARRVSLKDPQENKGLPTRSGPEAPAEMEPTEEAAVFLGLRYLDPRAPNTETAIPMAVAIPVQKGRKVKSAA